MKHFGVKSGEQLPVQETLITEIFLLIYLEIFSAVRIMINVNFLQPNSNESWKNFSLFSFLKARVDAELLMQIKEDFYSEIILFSIVTPQTDATGGRRRHGDN